MRRRDRRTESGSGASRPRPTSTGGVLLLERLTNLEMMTMSVRSRIDEKIQALFRECREIHDDPSVIPEMKRRVWRMLGECDRLTEMMGQGWTVYELTGTCPPKEEVTSESK